MKPFLPLLLFVSLAAAQVFPYSCLYGYFAFPAWGETGRPEIPSLYYDLQYEKRQVVTGIQYDERIGNYVVYVGWVYAKN